MRAIRLAGGSVYYLYDLAGHVITEVNSSGGWNRGETRRLRPERIYGIYAASRHVASSLGRPDAFTDTGRSALSEPDRFMTPDWSAKAEPVPYAKLADPQSLNLYAYVLDNPATVEDPDGHTCAEAISCSAEAGGAIGTVIEPGGGTAVGATVGAIVGVAITIVAIHHFAHKSVPKGSSGGSTAGRRFTPAQTAEDSGRPCTYCGQATTEEAGHPNSRESDHVIPKSRGGNAEPENRAPSCRTCNRQKGARTPEEWKASKQQPPPQS